MEISLNVSNVPIYFPVPKISPPWAVDHRLATLGLGYRKSTQLKVFLPRTNPGHDKRSYSYMQDMRAPPIQFPCAPLRKVIDHILQAMDL
jgi:hypothetical protein